MLLERFLPRLNFASYEDFAHHYEVRVPAGFNFAFDVVDETARLHPQHTALVWCDDEGRERRFTFSEMGTASSRAANFLHACGIRKGMPVMLVLKRRYEFWIALLALHKLGAVAIPATHLLTVKDFAYRFRAAEVQAVLCVRDADLRRRVDEAEHQTGRLTAKIAAGDPDGNDTGTGGWLDFATGLAASPAEFPRPHGADAVRNDDTSLLYFTSGTTGLPKMVRHDFAYPLGHIHTARFWQQVEPGGLHLTVADTGWAKAAWGKIYGQWLAGAAVMVYDYDRFDAGRMLGVLERYGVTSFCAPPTLYRYLIREAIRPGMLDKLKHASVAGEPLNPEVYERFRQLTGLCLHEGYGQTEMALAIGTFPWFPPRPGSMGKPAPGYDIDLMDENGSTCPAGVTGQIVIRTDKRRPPGMFTGYHRDPELTARVWNNGVYFTGDVAWRDADGYYWFVGRMDDVIKSSGYRIGPFEVESALMEHPAVLECAVTGVPDPDRGQAVKATVVLAKGWEASPELAKALQEHVRGTTAPYKYPRLIEFVCELPKTISGKIRRVALRGPSKD